MKIKQIWSVAFAIFGLGTVHAQNTTSITLQQAVEMALSQSDQAKIAQAKVTTAESALNVTKNLQYPDAKISGQYMYLTTADIDLKLNSGSESSGDAEGSSAAPDVHQLLLGQASVSVPVFSGFKLKNLVSASENQYLAATYQAKDDNERIALKVIQDYINLYKANQTITLIEENLKSAQQRVTDFMAMEQNGLLARNDLLKAQLQESNIDVTLKEAKKAAYILNYKLATFLKLPEGTLIEPMETQFGMVTLSETAPTIERNDLEALQYEKQASENEIKVAQSKYYPSLALSGGYIALDLQNTLAVTNAVNVGVGLSYNLSDIFKAKSDIKLAKSKAQQLEYTVAAFSDQIKVEVENAQQEYELAVEKYELYTKSEEQAAENYRIVKDKYENGLVDTNDLLEADIDQLTAKINRTNANANITQKYYELLTAEGQLTNTINN